MKSDRKRTGLYLFAGVCLFISLSLRAQSLQPTNWSTFVNSTANLSIQDTFYLQTFQEQSMDNWEYSVTGTASIEDITKLDAALGTHSPKVLKVSAKTEVKFEHYEIAPFDSTNIYARIYTRDNIRFKAYREIDQPDISYEINGDKDFKKIKITKTPPAIDFIITSLPTDGYMYIDSVMAYGYNRQYSLFTGSGSWSDKERWSHLPARRSNTALLNGQVTLHDEVTTQAVQISGGSLHISEEGALQTQILTLYDTANSHAALTASGTLEVKEKLIIEKTLPAKGKWYFFSLPFDVYADQMEGFTFKDQTETGSGNYFYLRTYDGAKRANGEPGWSVVSASQTADQPIIHKHQGYLIALDAAASTTTLRFHCESKEIPETFGKEVSMDIVPCSGEEAADAGWILCGNPLPAPLPLRNIAETDVLDGYIYLYQNGAYEAYSLDSEYAIAPYTAFFVKAGEETCLEITPSTAEVSTARLLSCESPLRASQEPKSNPTSNQTKPATNEVRILQEPNQIRIERLPEASIATWFNAQGQIIHTEALPSGNAILSYPSTSGFYLLHLQAGSWKRMIKGVR